MTVVSGADPRRAAVNPFSTRWTAPGRVAPRDGCGLPRDLTALVIALRGGGGRGSIEGPHGSGKTTLLVALARLLAERGELAGLYRARSPGTAGAVIAGCCRSAPATTVCIDSWEQLGFLGRGAVLAATRILGIGLLVTAHRASGLPLLVRCTVTPDLLQDIVAALPDHGGCIGRSDVEQAFARHAGNLREALYDLYDLYERRRHDGAP